MNDDRGFIDTALGTDSVASKRTRNEVQVETGPSR